MKLPSWLKLVSGELETDDDKPVDLLFCDSVGEGGVSAREFGYALNSINRKKPINILINSPGGSVHEGMAIHNIMIARGNVDVIVIGIAASMGSIIAQAGRTRKMMAGTMMMIHNPATYNDGDHREMEQTAELLKAVKKNLVDIYAARTGRGKREISDMMDATTFMTAKEALDLGFCDSIVDASTIYNDLAKISPVNVVENFRQTIVASLGNGVVGGGKKQKETEMKKTMAALVAQGLIASAELTDESAAAQLEQNIKTITDENKRFKAEQKARVEAAVSAAITEKLVKAERKDTLIAMGVRDEKEFNDYLADLRDVRAQAAGEVEAQPKQKRGAPPAPRGKAEGEGEGEDSEGEETADEKIKKLQASMKGKSSSEVAAIARQIRELRGRKDLFTVK